MLNSRNILLYFLEDISIILATHFNTNFCTCFRSNMAVYNWPTHNVITILDCKDIV